MDPFDLQSPEEPSRLGRLFRRAPAANALVELNNLFAAAHHLGEVHLEDVLRIGRRYEVDLHRAFPEERAALYRRFLLHALRDAAVDAEEASDMDALQRLLGLTDEQVRAAHEEAFGAGADALLADDCLDDADRAALETLRARLDLPLTASADLYAARARHRLLRRVREVLCDGRLSEEEERSIRAAYERLGVLLPSEVEAQLRHARHAWEAEHGALPVLAGVTKLVRGEACHFVTGAEWCRVRRPLVPDSAGMPSYRARLREGGGVRFEGGRPAPLSGTALSEAGAGPLCLTNKRIFLASDPQQYHVGLSKLYDFAPYANGVLLFRKPGEPVFLRFEDRVPLFATILARLLLERRRTS